MSITIARPIIRKHLYQISLKFRHFVQGSLEDQLRRLKEYEAGVYAYKPHIEELERIHQAVQEGMIFENRSILLLS